MTDKIKGIVVWIRTDKGLYEAELSREVLRRIWVVIDSEQIILLTEPKKIKDEKTKPSINIARSE